MRILRFCLLTVLLSACSGTAAPLLTPTATATIMPPSTPTSTEAGCIHGSEVDTSYSDRNICVFGDVVGIENAKGSGFYFIRFGDGATPAFYLMQNFEPEMQVGDCISVTGTLQFDGNGVPFMDEGEIKICNPEP